MTDTSSVRTPAQQAADRQRWNDAQAQRDAQADQERESNARVIALLWPNGTGAQAEEA